MIISFEAFGGFDNIGKDKKSLHCLKSMQIDFIQVPNETLLFAKFAKRLLYDETRPQNHKGRNSYFEEDGKVVLQHKQKRKQYLLSFPSLTASGRWRLVGRIETASPSPASILTFNSVPWKTKDPLL